MKKAKLLTDTLTPNFLYSVLEIKNGFVKLGWQTRDWNETDVLEKDVEIVEVDDDVHYLTKEIKVK
jgi:phosphosulfolactate synthase (CoM biosynthesis protein A)